MRLLLVEDELRLVEALAQILKNKGYSVDCAMDGDSGLEMALTGVYDVIILDRMLPKKDGVTLLKEFRQMGFDMPVILLTAKDTLQDKVDGLDAGADDYLVKPFSKEELLARIRSLSRRRNKEIVTDNITAMDWVLDPLRGEVTIQNNVVKLTRKEALVLGVLMSNYGNVVSKERLWEKVWGYYVDTEIANVDLYIHYLRKKLNTNFIETIRGIGYCLKER